MSIEKLNFQKLVKENTPFTTIINSVVQNIDNAEAGFLWVYLCTLPPNWEVNKEQLKKHFNFGEKKIKSILSYLHKINLITYVQLRKGTHYGPVCIKVLCGKDFPYLSKDESAGSILVRAAFGTSRKDRHINTNKDINENKDINKNICASDDARSFYDQANSSFDDQNQKPKSKALGKEMILSRFDEFWSAYPRKEDKKRTKDIWGRKKLDEKADFIIQRVIEFKEQNWKGKESFIPHASTFLNGERWNDELNSEQQKGYVYESANTSKPEKFDVLRHSMQRIEQSRRHESNRY